MGILFKQKTYILAAAAAALFCVMMIAFSDIAILSAKKGIALWTASVLPAMLPFFICVNFMTGIGLTALLPRSVFPFVMSVLSGYPMGAKVVGDMYRNGVIDNHEARKLMSYCSTAGPVFMIGAVGSGMLGSQAAGCIIAVSHYLGTALNGILFTITFRSERKDKGVLTEHRRDEADLLEILTASIFAAFRSIAVILAYIIFFMFIMDLLEFMGLFELFTSEYLQGLLRGAIEMTVGCGLLPHNSLLSDCVMATVIISWGGLSVLGQSTSMLAGTGINASYLALTKVTHSIFAGIIALFLGNVML